MRENVFLRDTALDNIDPNDGRRIEVVVSGMPIARGIPIAVDATLVSPLHADGTPHPHTVTRPGASFRRAEASKANTYPELVNSSLLQLLTVASETGGRLNRTGCKLLEDVAAVRARAAQAAGAGPAPAPRARAAPLALAFSAAAATQHAAPAPSAPPRRPAPWARLAAPLLM